jgi:hypothetical protein
MKISQFFALVLMLAVASAVAFADPIQDPKIIIKGAGGGALLEQGICEQCVGVGSNFSFTVPASGTGNLFFTNESGSNWNSLTLIEKGVPAVDISCRSQLFSSCTTETLKNGSVEILLTNNSRSLWKDKGIPNGANFQISFSCVKGNCWPGGLQFNGHGSSSLTGTPEPATLGLMITGLGALVSRRKLWKNRFNA